MTVGETGLRVTDRSDHGSGRVVWAAVVTNTSGTDLLARAFFDVTWRTPSGESKVRPWHDGDQQRVFDLRPGESAVLGGRATTLGFVPESLDVSVQVDDWFPVRDLAVHGFSAGSEVTSYRLEPAEEGSVRVEAELVSEYEPRASGELTVVAVLRDTDGGLVGAVEAAHLPPVPGGDRHATGVIEAESWPDDADLDASEVVVVKRCCAWIGVN